MRRAKRFKTYEIDIFQEILVRVDSRNKFKYDNAETINVALHRELVRRHVFRVYVTICTFQA